MEPFGRNTKESLSISVTSFTKFPLLNSRLRSEFHYDTDEHNFLDGAFDDFCLDHMFEDTKVQDNSGVKPSYSETVNNNNNIRIRNDNESRKNTLSVLHAIASLKTPMPGLLTCALFLHPKDLTQRDECGMLPLHHAILSYNPSSCHSRGKKRGSDNFEFENTERDIYYNENEAQEGNQYICEKDRPFFLRRCEIISVLVHSCVPSASYLSPDGDLPINMILKRGGVPWENGLREVALAAPDALSTRDKKTHLYPFMLAAVKNINSVDTVY
eukprot:CAMPEP_0178974824 /NCGR_PEP_ID=MMETSP0789-20121207/22728_1 /TAXON_ID=3005 /ORGANISM="Rhizosolenia setigera, Strain CCMP 1694" /LENGTH=270 /DNA_ID=CAMNT_0020663315 /DNA_START=150 /DNA_END=959 /DNA_ORIENTATION=+